LPPETGASGKLFSCEQPPHAARRNLPALEKQLMNRDGQDDNNFPGFVFGLVTGAALGAGLALYFAPKMAAEIRKRVTDSARDLSDTASGYYEQVSGRVSDAVDDLTSRGQQARDAAADVVARGAQEVGRGARGVGRGAAEVARNAHEVERFAEGAKTGH
jgi:gas vesicle protein